MGRSPRRSLADGRMRVPRLTDAVAERIRELIISGELADGARLPPVDALVEDFGVSSPSMREALRMLEAEGLISVQRGSIGGAVVHGPTDRTAAYTLALVLSSRGTSIGDVAEAMAMLDPVCATLCARRPDRRRTVVRELQKANSAARQLLDGDAVQFNDEMTGFHAVILRRCGNNTLTLLAGALGAIWLVHVREWAKRVAAHGEFPTHSERLRSIEAHENVTDLIAAGEDLRVAQAMTEHIDMRAVVSAAESKRTVDARAIRLAKRGG